VRKGFPLGTASKTKKLIPRIKPFNFCKYTIHLTINNMEFKNVTLAALLITLLITGLVESAGRKTPKGTCDLVNLMSRLSVPLAPQTMNGSPTETLQEAGDRLAPSCEKPKEKKERKKKRRLPELLTEQGTFSVPAEDPIPSSPEANGFIEAAQKDDMNAAFDVFDGGNDELKKYCGKYLVSLGSPRLVELINRANDDIKKWMLQVILVHADQQLVNKVFGKVNPPNKLLRKVASSADLACIPQRFIYLLGRSEDKVDQKWAVISGVYART
jgi:hypothetical protein